MKRRHFSQLLGVSQTLPLSLVAAFANTAPSNILKKKVPSSGYLLPVIGMGTWISFNVGDNKALRQARAEVLRKFFQLGGGLVDSSPMYGSSEAVLGYCLKKLSYPSSLFSATKVWTNNTEEGRNQVTDSQRLWGINQFDLQQVHNLLNWRPHLKHLLQLKEKGVIKHVGITTSHGRRHDELASILKNETIDFVQLTYNIENREVERRLLDLAQDKSIAVIANRPYGGGKLIRKAKSKPLPPWAKEIACHNWPEFLLKFVVSHPAVTCAIPATSQLAHMQENMLAGYGALPDQTTRERMAKYFASL